MSASFPPFSSPPLGFDREDTGITRLLAVVWTLSTLAIIFTGLRIYCKLKSSRRLWWDDFILLGSLIMVLANSTIVSVSTQFGLGTHIIFVPQTTLPTLGLLNNFSATVSIIGAVWSKTSFAVTMLRVLPQEGIFGRKFAWFVIVTMNLFMGLSALFTWISCNPIQKTWNRNMPGTCWNPASKIDYDIFSGTWSGLMDLTLALLPWKIVWGLQMKKKEKLGVAIAMSMGVLAGATAFVKCAQLSTWIGGDFTYNLVELSIWGTAENTTTIMAASIPVLRVLIRDVHSNARSYLKMSMSRKERTVTGNEVSISVNSGHQATGGIVSGNTPVIFQTKEVTVDRSNEWPSSSTREYDLDDMGNKIYRV